MTIPEADARFDATPEEALAALEGHRGPVVVDLDETLLLANSTTLFLDSARPGFLVYLVVKVSDTIASWRRSAADADTRRVRAVLTVLPWSRRMWQRRVRQIAPELLNRPLLDAISRADGPVIVSTKGFAPIVEPIIAQAGIDDVRVVAMDPGSQEDRDEAKFRLTVEAAAPANLDRCLVVTDSLADHRLLEASAAPLRVVWPLVRRDACSPASTSPAATWRSSGRRLAMCARSSRRTWPSGYWAVSGWRAIRSATSPG